MMFLLAAEYFYPRSPCGERHITTITICIVLIFLSTLSLRRATHYDNYNLHCVDISIHALLAESDDTSKDIIKTARNFYPRSPCGERQDTVSAPNRPQEFLSTLSLRRATHQQGYHQDCQKFLSTLSLRRATENANNSSNTNLDFYPRSPCGERQCIP